MRKQLFLTLLVFILSDKLTAQTILGIDVNNKGTINWQQVATSGKVFAWAKATEGYTFDDQAFSTYMTNGTNAGVKMGAYHFARPDNNSAINEANHFLAIAASYIGPGRLPPALDLEDITDANGNVIKYLSNLFTSAQLTTWVQTWLTTVQNATGVAPIIYTTSFYAGYLNSSLNIYKLWIAKPDGSATNPPTGLGSWNTWAFKQYSWTGTVPGITGNVDLNVFNGDLTAFNSLINVTPPSPPANDNCNTTTLLTSTANCIYTNNQTVNNATASGKPKGSCDNFGSPALADVWYYFQAIGTSTTITVDPNGSALDAVILAYNSCSNNNEVGCSDVTGAGLSTLTVQTIPGNYYYVRVYDYGLQTTNGNFRICLQHTAPPAATINSFSILPTTARQDGSFNLTYNISASTAMTVMLGTSIRPTGSQTYYDDVPSDIKITLPSGTANQTRSFHLYCEPTGSYDVFVAIWNDNNNNNAIDQNDILLSSISTNQLLNVTSGIPSIPSSTNASNINSAGFTANWSSVSSATGYYVDVATNSSFTNLIYANAAVGNVTSYTFQGLICGTTYYYRVRAGAACGYSNYSSTISVTTNSCCTPPSSPVATSASYIAFEAFQANWNVVSGATSYFLDVATDPSFTNFLAGYQNKNIGNIDYANVSPLTCGTTYYYRVRSMTSCNSASSNTITTSTLACCPVLSSPTATFGSDNCPGTPLNSATTASLNFVNNGGISFNGLVWKYPFTFDLNATDCFTGSPIVHTGLTKGMLYRWALNAYGYSNCSLCQSNLSNYKFFHLPPEVTYNGNIPTTNLSICQGSTITLTTLLQSPGAGASVNYKWLRNGILFQQGINLTSIQVNQAGTYTLALEYTGSTVCSGTVSTNASNAITVVSTNTNNWVGVISNSWHNPLNWSCGVVPDETTEVVINQGTPYTCVIAIPAICKKITVLNGARLDAKAKLTVMQ